MLYLCQLGLGTQSSLPLSILTTCESPEQSLFEAKRSSFDEGQEVDL